MKETDSSLSSLRPESHLSLNLRFFLCGLRIAAFKIILIRVLFRSRSPIGRSGHRRSFMREPFMYLVVDDVGDALHRLPHVMEADIERGEPQANVVGRTEIGDHLHVFDHGPDDPEGIGMTDGDLRAPSPLVAGRAEDKPP